MIQGHPCQFYVEAKLIVVPVKNEKKPTNNSNAKEPKICFHFRNNGMFGGL